MKTMTNIILLLGTITLLANSGMSQFTFPESGSNGLSATDTNERRAEIRAKYDFDQNGLLNLYERLAIRVAALSGEIPLPKNASNELRGFAEQVRVDYDIDSNGALDEGERLLLEWDIYDGAITIPREGNFRPAS